MERNEVVFLLMAKLNNSAIIGPYRQADLFPGVTGRDVAHALGTIKIHGPSEAARFKWAGQDAMYSSAADYLSFVVSSVKKHKTSKDGIGKDMHRQMCKCAVDEHARDPRCQICKGDRMVTIQGKQYDCTHCHGLGYISFATTRRERMGVSYEDWKYWEPHYLSSLFCLDRWEDLVYSTLMRHFWPHIKPVFLQTVLGESLARVAREQTAY